MRVSFPPASQQQMNSDWTAQDQYDSPTLLRHRCLFFQLGACEREEKNSGYFSCLGEYCNSVLL